MEPIQPPKTLKVYTLIRQTGLTFSYTGYSAGHTLGTGFFMTLQEAEHQRTLEHLKETSTTKSCFHVFELEVPNPAYQQ